MTHRGLGARIGEVGERVRGLRPSRSKAERRDRRRARGAAELSVVVVSASLVAGVFFGQGLSRTAVDLADGLTWLSDSPSGEVIQVNPATGELQVRQLVGKPGDDLAVAQYDGQLFVTNHTTGQLMSFDLTSILVSGQRRVSPGGVVDTLVDGHHAFLVDSEQSTIAAMDPVGTDAIGTIWVAPSGLADAAIDQTGAVWAIEDDGTLHQLRWSDETQSFDDVETRTVEYSGPGSVLVAHDEGVTVFGPDEGIVSQVGTDHEYDADAPKLSGKIFAPEHAPSDLVPVADGDSGTVVIASPDGVREVDMGTVECPEPGTPEVFRGTVYVPCTGSGKVVRLSPTGARADDDIETPGATDPELVLDDDNLVINTPGAPRGVVVHDDGSVTSVTREDAEIPISTPGNTEQPPAANPLAVLDDLLGDLTGKDKDKDKQDQGSPQNDAADPDDPDSTGPRDSDGNGDGDGDTCERGRTCSHQSDGDGKSGDDKSGDGNGKDDDEEAASPINAPTEVSAVALPEGQVEITWNHDSTPKVDAFVVRDTTGEEYARVKSTVRRAIITVTPGESRSYTVSAVLDDEEATSIATPPVTTTARPGAPTVTATSAYTGDDREQRFEVTVSWNGAVANGAAITRYDVTVTTPDGAQTRTTDGTTRKTTLSWTCDLEKDPSCQVGGDYTTTVVGSNALGNGAPGTATGVAPAQPPPPLPDAGQQVVDRRSPDKTSATQEGDGQITLKLKPPQDWSRFPGSCTYTVTGGTRAGDAGGAVACNATSVTISFFNGYLYEPASGDVGHTVVFHAGNEGGTVDSAPFTFTSQQQPLCANCQPY